MTASSGEQDPGIAHGVWRFLALRGGIDGIDAYCAQFCDASHLKALVQGKQFKAAHEYFGKAAANKRLDAKSKAKDLRRTLRDYAADAEVGGLDEISANDITDLLELVDAVRHEVPFEDAFERGCAAASEPPIDETVAQLRTDLSRLQETIAQLERTQVSELELARRTAYDAGWMDHASCTQQALEVEIVTAGQRAVSQAMQKADKLIEAQRTTWVSKAESGVARSPARGYGAALFS